MPIDVTAGILGLLAGITPAAPWLHRSGPWVVPLVGATRATREAATRIGRDAAVQIEETRPPQASAVTVRNAGRSAEVVHVGDVFLGGCAARAAAQSALVRGGEQRIVRVEALESRWWPDGRLTAGWALEPPSVAALLLMREASAGLAAMAQTALWAVAQQGLHPHDDLPPRQRSARGWVLSAHGRVLAAVVHRAGRPGIDAPGVESDGLSPAVVGSGAGERARAATAARSWLASLAGAAWAATGDLPRVERDGLILRALVYAGEVVEVAAVRPSADIPSTLVRMATGGEQPGA